ncbi:MAG: hypothetical protein ACKO1M_06990 [Planctomycetota bacterium]
MVSRASVVWMVGVVVGCFSLTAVDLRVGAWADDDHDEFEHLMEKVHEGKRSPYRQLRGQVAAAAPAWPAVDANLPAFQAMARALAESRDDDIKGSADGYVEAVGEIVAAARQRDQRSLGEAFESLTQSCGDCHFEGGVGGELED